MNADRKPLLRPVLIIALLGIILAAAFILFRVFMPTRPEPAPERPSLPTRWQGRQCRPMATLAAPGNDYSVQVVLAEGQAQTPTPLVEPVATGEPLTSDEIEAIFNRAPGSARLPR